MIHAPHPLPRVVQDGTAELVHVPASPIWRTLTHGLRQAIDDGSQLKGPLEKIRDKYLNGLMQEYDAVIELRGPYSNQLKPYADAYKAMVEQTGHRPVWVNHPASEDLDREACAYAHCFDNDDGQFFIGEQCDTPNRAVVYAVEAARAAARGRVDVAIDLSRMALEELEAIKQKPTV